jgi:hypothetical protein
MLVYENPELGFKIDYPSNWTKAGNDKGSIPVMFSLTESEDGITTSPQPVPTTDKKIKANILVNVQPAGPLSLQQTGNGETQQMKASLEKFSLKKINELINSRNTKFNILENNPAATIGVKNVPAYQLVYNGTKITDNSKVKGFDIFTIQGDKVYNILYLAEEKDYDKLLPTIQMMTNSFELLDSNISPIAANNPDVSSIFSSTDNKVVGKDEENDKHDDDDGDSKDNDDDDGDSKDNDDDDGDSKDNDDDDGDSKDNDDDGGDDN